MSSRQWLKSTKYNKYSDSDMFGYNNPIVKDDLTDISHKVDWSRFNNKTILITGANGHIASYLIYSFAYAIDCGIITADIIAVSRNKDKLMSLYAPLTQKKWFSIIVGDVSNPIDYSYEIDYIFHFAGNASPYYISNDPVGILRANISGTFNICELARRNTDCKIIYASTREVYGDNKLDQSLTETSFGALDPLDRRSCYPESKRAAETILEAYHNQYRIKYAVTRIAHCYGPGMKLANDGRVMSDFINNAVSCNDIVLNSDGKALRSFCYISDVITALLIIASDESDNSVFNLSNETEEISILELAEKIASAKGDIKVIVKAREVDASLYCNYKRKPLDCSRLNALGWHPTVKLHHGITRTLQSFDTKR